MCLLERGGKVGALGRGERDGKRVERVDEGSRRAARGGVGEEGLEGVREGLGPDAGGGRLGRLVLSSLGEAGCESVGPDAAREES